MSLIKLNSLTSRFACYNLLRRFIGNHNGRALQTDNIPSKENKSNGDEETDEPIQYSTSPAAMWSAEHSQKGDNNDIPWFQPIIVSGSTIIFMIYFFILRESNDIDEIFELELGDHFKHIDTNAMKKPPGVSIDDRQNKNIK